MLIGPLPGSAADRVLQGMRGEILSGARSGGSRIIEDEVAAHYGVSRLPVREALRWLALDGLMERRPRRSGHIRSVTLTDIADISEAYLLFDRIAATRAAQGATATHIAALQNGLAHIEAAAAQSDDRALAATGHHFRNSVYDAARSSALHEVREALHWRMLQLFARISPDTVSPAPYCRSVVTAISAHDAAAADEGMLRFGEHLAAALRHRMRDELQRPGGPRQMALAPALPEGSGEEGFTPGFMMIRDSVRESIVSGKRPPGATLAGRVLASEFGVSRYPALEAVEALMWEGLATPTPARVAPRVALQDATQAQDLADFGVLADLAVIPLAAERATPAGLARLEEILAAETAAIAADDPDSLAHLFAFHRQLHEMTGNRLLIEVRYKLEARMRMAAAEHSRVPAGILPIHRGILHAIAVRDGELAADLYRAAFTRTSRAGVTGARLVGFGWSRSAPQRRTHAP